MKVVGIIYHFLFQLNKTKKINEFISNYFKLKLEKEDNFRNFNQNDSKWMVVIQIQLISCVFIGHNFLCLIDHTYIHFYRFDSLAFSLQLIELLYNTCILCDDVNIMELNVNYSFRSINVLVWLVVSAFSLLAFLYAFKLLHATMWKELLLFLVFWLPYRT